MSQPSRRRIPLLGWVGAAVLAISLAAVSLGLHTPGPGPVDDGQTGSPRRVVTFGFVDVPDGPTPVYPVVAGRVTAVNVKEHDTVHKDKTILFTLDDRQAQLKLSQAKADLEAAKEQAEQAKDQVEQHKRAVVAQERGARAKHAEADAQLQAARARHAETAAAQAEAAEVERIHKAGSTSKEKLEAANKIVEVRREAAVAADKAAEASRQAADAEDARTEALKAMNPAQVRRAEAQVAAREEQVKEAQLGVDQCSIKAPGDGTVLRVNLTIGAVHGPTAPQPAMIFCPAGPRIVRAEVDQEWAGRVFVGQKAAIQDDSRSGPSWSGKVTHLSPWFTHRRSMILEPLQFNDIRTLEAIIELDDDADLRIGQRMKVTLEPKN